MTAMHFEILVEEPSAEKTLDNLLPKIITGEHTYKIITFQGKNDLLLKLPAILRGYSKWINQDYRIIVLIDRDSSDCHELKNRLEKFAIDAGLTTKSSVQINAPFNVLNRIAIEELEAWFFGDTQAMLQAYPRLPSKFSRNRNLRDPDNIQGGTWEALEKLLQRAGYYKTGLRKIETADKISQYMSPLHNRSRSFQIFWEGVSTCINNR